MADLVLNLRLIDRQEAIGTLQEIYEGPDSRRVRFFVRTSVDPIAVSQVWTGSGWKLVHSLIEPGPAPRDAVLRLFRTTEEILGWSNEAQIQNISRST